VADLGKIAVIDAQTFPPNASSYNTSEAVLLPSITAPFGLAFACINKANVVASSATLIKWSVLTTIICFLVATLIY